MAVPIPNLNVNTNNTASGRSDGQFSKNGDFIIGSKGMTIPWYVWAAVAVAALVWAKKHK